MNLSAILPLPASVAQRPTSVFVAVDGQPVLTRIVRALSSVADVLVAVDDRLLDDARSCLDGMAAVQVLGTGETSDTADCLTVAAQHARRTGATHVLVADHRYPVVSEDLVARVIAALADGADRVVPVLPVTDTVKSVDAQGVIRATVDRAELLVTQYPYGTTLAGLGDLATVLAAGPETVAGDADAIPFDLPDDAALLEAVIACRR